MSVSIATFHSDLEKLIRKFQADQQYYSSKDYLEAQARMDLITPFFKAMGWDVENEAGLLHHDREVLVEKGDMEATGRPDYNFRIGGQTKFYVEAKPPSEPLDTPRHILQAKGYVWNTKSVYFVILTNFEEFCFYDASAQPDPKRPEEGLLLRLRYSDYPANAGKLWEFSRERVAAGSLEALLPKIRRAPRLRKQVDDVFLDEMTGWREELAKNIHKNNPDLTARQLNEVVQRLLDRIVFIRIAEDRKVLEYGQLRRVLEDWEIHGGKFHIFDWLNDLFHKVNEDFNGEIFKPHLSETIKIDSELLARIIKRLYPPESPYRFDVIGVELLGSIYERYLGNTIRLTPKQVKVEEKPEVRKAGGVYYTPRYIVDYIVRETVGKAIVGKSPKQIEKIRILDPACGSGSFLIGAFQYLIDYHVKWYLAHPEQEVRHAHPSLDFMREVHTDPDGAKRLSVYRKAKILRHNLFGVDIDPQAVEITMMSLYLKALEGEKSQLPAKQHILPELKYNIQCGNSLIGPDIYDQGLLFAEDERDRINAFDWSAVAPVSPPATGDEDIAATKTNRLSQGGAPAPSIGQVMRSGGFDVVIGNPPYIRIQEMKEWAPVEVEFYKQHYKAASSGNYDIYVVFIEKGLSLLKEKGKLGFICPHKFFNAQYGAPLRKLLSEGKNLAHIVHFSDQQVFEGATTYTCLLFLEESGSKQLQFEKVNDLETWRTTGDATEGSIPVANITASEWNFTIGAGAELFEKLSRISVRLADEARIFQGLVTGADPVFILKEICPARRGLIKVQDREGREWLLEEEILRPFLSKVTVETYVAPVPAHRLIFPYHLHIGEAELIPTKEMMGSFPRTWEYLKDKARVLRGREGGKWNHDQWYAFGRNQNLTQMGDPKLIIQVISRTGAYAFDETGVYFTGGGNGPYYGVRWLSSENPHSLHYLQALLSSTLLDWYLHRISSPFRGGYWSYGKRFIEQLPIRPINFSDPADKARHDKMVELVDRMLELNKQKHSGKLAPSQVDRIDREIAATDAEIDHLVYELYGIADEERKIIEAT